MAKAKPLPSQEELSELLDYNTYTGIVKWKERTMSMYSRKRDLDLFNERYANKIINTKDKQGYLIIVINYSTYRLHRVIYKLIYNKEPELIDHENQIKDDNRLDNLRASNNELNGKNSPKTSRNTSGVVGVSFNTKKNKWQASACLRKKLIFLGYFDSLEEAAKVRKEAEIDFGYSRNHGK